MSRQLNISNKLVSIRDRMLVTDSAGHTIYEAAGDFTLFRKTWRVYKGGAQVAVIKHKIFSWSSTWLVSGALGEFKVRRKIFSLTRGYKIIGGAYDGTNVSGSIFGFTFEIIRKGATIASAHDKILTIRDTYMIDVISENSDDELLTVIALVALRLDKESEEQAEELQRKKRAD